MWVAIGVGAALLIVLLALLLRALLGKDDSEREWEQTLYRPAPPASHFGNSGAPETWAESGAAPEHERTMVRSIPREIILPRGSSGGLEEHEYADYLDDSADEYADDEDYPPEETIMIGRGHKDMPAYEIRGPAANQETGFSRIADAGLRRRLPVLLQTSSDFLPRHLRRDQARSEIDVMHDVWRRVSRASRDFYGSNPPMNNDFVDDYMLERSTRATEGLTGWTATSQQVTEHMAMWIDGLVAAESALESALSRPRAPRQEIFRTAAEAKVRHLFSELSRNRQVDPLFNSLAAALLRRERWSDGSPHEFLEMLLFVDADRDLRSLTRTALQSNDAARMGVQRNQLRWDAFDFRGKERVAQANAIAQAIR